MDIKEVREILATKGMGYVWNEFEGLEMWGIPNREGIELKCWIDEWQPDINPKQMMKVIDAMIAKHWDFVIKIRGDGATVSCQRFAGKGESGYSGRQESLCYAVSLAVYRALEATND